MTVEADSNEKPNPGDHECPPADQAQPSLTDKRLAENVETLQVENFIEAYQITADWIRFADAKATVILTVAGVVASVLIPTLKPFFHQPAEEHLFGWWPVVAGVLFAGWLVFTGLASVWAFLCVHPFQRQGRHPALDRCSHFHAAGISAHYTLDDTTAFIQDCEDLGMPGLKKEVLAGLLIDAHISNSKYQRVKRAIQLLGVSAIFGLLYTLAIQF